MFLRCEVVAYLVVVRAQAARDALLEGVQDVDERVEVRVKCSREGSVLFFGVPFAQERAQMQPD